jgi:hypothetical protein
MLIAYRPCIHLYQFLVSLSSCPHSTITFYCGGSVRLSPIFKYIKIASYSLGPGPVISLIVFHGTGSTSPCFIRWDVMLPWTFGIINHDIIDLDPYFVSIKPNWKHNRELFKFSFFLSLNLSRWCIFSTVILCWLIICKISLTLQWSVCARNHSASTLCSHNFNLCWLSIRRVSLTVLLTQSILAGF